MALFPRVFQNDFAPMFKLMDDYANHVATRDPFNASGESLASRLRTSFSPRFDFKENKDAYELHGELPGVEQKDVEIEFTDANTLSIRGRTERVREEGTRPAAIEGVDNTQKRIGDRKDSHSYHKPTVEEEDGAVASGANPDAQLQTESQSQDVEKTGEDEGPKYWISERSVGTFARSFTFPQRVDQDAVKASLKNGILSIVVPKAAPVSRRITVE
jgi:HSP20 family molecular chaperone IbpA